MSEGTIIGFSNPVTAVIGVIGSIIKFLTGLGGGMKSFVHDVTLSLKLSWGAMAGPILGAFDLVKGWVIGLIKRIKKIIEILQEKIGKVLGPIIKYAKQVRIFWDHIFNQYVRPILNAIQHIRQTLAIFKVFHLKFATALDQRLAKLEGDIAGRFLIFKQKLNQVLSIMEFWADPEGFIKASAIWRGLTQSLEGLGALIRGFAFENLPAPPAIKSMKQTADENRTEIKAMLTRYQTGTLNEDETRHIAELKSLFT